jgi:hypothetical protein
MTSGDGESLDKSCGINTVADKNAAQGLGIDGHTIGGSGITDKADPSFHCDIMFIVNSTGNQYCIPGTG